MFSIQEKVYGQYQKEKRDGFEPPEHIDTVYQRNTKNPQLWVKRILFERPEDEVKNTKLEKKVRELE